MSATQTALLETPEQKSTIYTRQFWLAYIANLSLVTANSLTFHFAELVAYLGGSEQIAGRIVSAGVLTAIAARLVLAQAIDHYGTRRSWTIASLIFITGCAMLFASSSLGIGIYIARITYAVGLASMFTCSIVHVQKQVPFHRRTEMIATLGTSGFIGMILGTQLGDFILWALPEGRAPFLILFGSSCVMGVIYFALIRLVTRHDVHEIPLETPAAHTLIFRHWPGPVTLVALMIGVAFTVTTVFLTRFSSERGLGGIGTFFTMFCVSAFIFRLMSRGWSKTIGRHRMILIGLAFQFIGLGSLTLVTRQWHFLLPGIGCGFGHALLFPSVVSLGAGKFPKQYHGSGTTIILGFTEVGAALSAPILGWVIDTYGFTTMLYSASGFNLVVFAFYAATSARRADNESGDDHKQQPKKQDDDSDDAGPGHGLPPRLDQLDPDESIVVPFPHLGRSA